MKRIKLILAVVAVMTAIIAASAAPAMADVVRSNDNHVRLNDFNAGNGFIFFFSSSNFGGFDDGLSDIISPNIDFDLD